MESTATARYLRKTSRKARLVADAIRGKKIGEALSLLEFSITKDVAKDFHKLLKSAVANMQSKNADVPIIVDDLKVKEVTVGAGPTLKRFRSCSQGRVAGILKRMCHISIKVSN